MSRRRRRSRRRSGSGAGWSVAAALAALVVVLAATTALPAASFDHGDSPRGTGANVTDDPNAVQALDNAADVRINATDRLTTVTNHLGRSVTVTVALRSDSRHIGDLVVDGTVEGNRTSFALGTGASQDVSVEIPDDSSLTDETVYFHVESTDPGIRVNASDRGVPVTG